MERSVHLRRLVLERSELIVGAAVLAVATAIWFLGWRGSDYPAQIFRIELLQDHGFSVWNPNWYGGHHTPGYGIVFPALAAAVGMATPALVSTVGSVVLMGGLLRAGRLPHALMGTWVFGFLMIVNLYVGRLPFALGLTFALVALCLALRHHAVLALTAALVASLSSPLAGAFLATALASWALAACRSDHRRVLRHPGTLLALGAVAPVAVCAVLFPEGGWFPYRVAHLVVAVVLGAVALTFLPPSLAGLRVAFGSAALLALPLFVVPNPIGGNWSRLTLVAAPVLCAVPWRRWLVPLVAGLTVVVWQAQPLLSIPANVADPSSDPEFHQPLVRALEALGDEPVRVEIPFTTGHWEAAYVADQILLARGWERQLDLRYNEVLYREDLDLDTYHRWLLDNGVSYVALPDVALEPESEREAALVEEAPYLRPVWSNPGWRLYAVEGSVGLVSGDAQLSELTGDVIRLEFPDAGESLLRVHFSPHLNVIGDNGCVLEGPDGWTTVIAFDAGPLEMDTNLAADDPDICDEPTVSPGVPRW